MSRENPMETFFNMEPGTVLPVDERPFANEVEDVDFANVQLVVVEDQLSSVNEPQPKVPFKETLDDEDLIIQEQLQAVFDKAVATFHNQQEMSEICDPKFSARSSEVAGSYLTTALNAIQLRARIKADKDKGKVNQQVGAIINGNQTTNNVVVTSRNDLLKMLHAKKNDFGGDGGVGGI